MSIPPTNGERTRPRRVGATCTPRELTNERVSPCVAPTDFSPAQPAVGDTLERRSVGDSGQCGPMSRRLQIHEVLAAPSGSGSCPIDHSTQLVLAAIYTPTGITSWPSSLNRFWRADPTSPLAPVIAIRMRRRVRESIVGDGYWWRCVAGRHAAIMTTAAVTEIANAASSEVTMLLDLPPPSGVDQVTGSW